MSSFNRSLILPNVGNSYILGFVMSTIKKIIDTVEAIERPILKPKDVAIILGVSLAWVYKKNSVPLEESCRGSTGKQEKKYYVVRKSDLISWLNDLGNQDKIVKAHYSSEAMKAVRRQRKK